MNNRDGRSFLHQAFQIGTPECAVFCALVAMLLGLLFLWIGFWKTLLIFCLMLLGIFIGGVEDKRAWLGEALNRLIPAKPPAAPREPRHGAGRTPRRAEQEAEVTPIPEEYHYEEPQE